MENVEQSQEDGSYEAIETPASELDSSGVDYSLESRKPSASLSQYA
jgi:hypothetical protein